MCPVHSFAQYMFLLLVDQRKDLEPRWSLSSLEVAVAVVPRW
jgi:hypothetical protein